MKIPIMQSFSSYLAEADFSKENFRRLLAIIEKRAQQALGKIYRYGGANGTEKFSNNVVGYLYFFDNRAFRVRAHAGRVLAIDVWNKYTTDKGPDFVIHLSELDADTIASAISQITNIIKSPSAKNIPIKEDVQLTEMAKRTAPADFYKLMVAKYGEDAAQSASTEQIKALASENDILIPSFIWSTIVGKGRAAKFNTAPQDAPVKAAKAAPTLYIKVTAQDPDTKKFISTADSPDAQKLYAQLQNSLNQPATDAEIKDPDTLYGHMAQLVQMAVKGSLRSLLIFGGPGSGKTFTIMKTISDAGMTKGKDFVKLSGKASPIEIYKTLFMFREGGLVVFDDLDSMWRNEDATNILKAALDTSPVREISWVSSQTINVSRMSDENKQVLFKSIDNMLDGSVVELPELTDEDREDMTAGEIKKYEREREKSSSAVSPDKIKYPSTFDFKGRVIFISNLKRDDFDSAIMSRSAKINMDLSPAQILERMRKILPTLGGGDVPLSKKQELLDHLLKMHKNKEITAVTMREFTRGLDIVRSGVKNWPELLVYS